MLIEPPLINQIMYTTILAFLKSFIINQIISWGKYYIFNRLPDWNDEAATLAFLQKYRERISSIAKSTNMQFDDKLASLYNKIIDNPDMFHIVYTAIMSNETPDIEVTKKSLLTRIKERFGFSDTVSESIAEDTILETQSLVEVIGMFKKLV